MSDSTVGYTWINTILRTRLKLYRDHIQGEGLQLMKFIIDSSVGFLDYSINIFVPKNIRKLLADNVNSCWIIFCVLARLID